MISNETCRKIANVYGTPTYVFDTEALQKRVRAIAEIFGPKVTLCYSIKANPFLIPAMLDVVDHLEVCSPGELQICEAIGRQGNEKLQDGHVIVYSGVNKQNTDIREAIRFGAGIYTAESKLHFKELNEEAGYAGKVIPVLLRLNSGAQFGMSREDLLELVETRADYPNVEIVGIHYFAGTQRKNKELHQQKEELEMVLSFMNEIEAKYGLKLKKLEYGPGLPVPLFNKDDYSDTLAPAREIAQTLQSVAEKVDLTVEMGRFFTTECGIYLTKVMDLKTVPEGDDKVKRYAILDGGIHHVNYLGQIMGMKVPVMRHLKEEEKEDFSACPHVAEMSEVRDTGEIVGMKTGEAGTIPASQSVEEHRGIEPLTLENANGEGNKTSDAGILTEDEKEAEAEHWALCGSLCTTNDDLVRDVEMTNLEMGDILVFENIGAYSITEAMYLFLSRTMPAVLLYNNGCIQCVRDFAESYIMNTGKFY